MSVLPWGNCGTLGAACVLRMSTMDTWEEQQGADAAPAAGGGRDEDKTMAGQGKGERQGWGWQGSSRGSEAGGGMAAVVGGYGLSVKSCRGQITGQPSWCYGWSDPGKPHSLSLQ